ncbi:MAG: type I-B CRISPR-associated protein Cas7/Csh2 [Thermodesulfobacterium sp.]|jgi:CRISPR-associated protein Csh2|nr:type I-B CRISPR-associated protein Cas7/Csh2 [Thermodesulfobacterium sp.]
MSTLSRRHEILFLYDVSMANPNGDPLDENRPRYDEETGRVFVRDARIKRTIRDTLAEMGHNVFIIEERKDNGELKTKEEKIAEVGSLDGILDTYIDIRLFGGTFAIKRNSWSLTGPVQFAYGVSLHRVKMLNIKGTTVMPSKEGKKQGTMLDDYRIAYALIAVYGVANQNAAEHTRMTDEDFEIMLNALWIGHKGGSVLLTGSKIGHMSRLLIDVVHKEGSLDLIGGLQRAVEVVSDKNDEEIRGPEDYKLSLERLAQKILKFKDKVEKIRYIADEELRVEPSIEEAFQGITVEKLEF